VRPAGIGSSEKNEVIELVANSCGSENRAGIKRAGAGAKSQSIALHHVGEVIGCRHASGTREVVGTNGGVSENVPWQKLHDGRIAQAAGPAGCCRYHDRYCFPRVKWLFRGIGEFTADRSKETQQ
jgi:hypothetical protein